MDTYVYTYTYTFKRRRETDRQTGAIKEAERQTQEHHTYDLVFLSCMASAIWLCSLYLIIWPESHVPVKLRKHSPWTPGMQKAEKEKSILLFLPV